MASRILLIVLLFSLLGSGTTFAKKKKNNPAAGPGSTIVEVSPMSVTISAGQDAQETYTIAGNTKITLDGAPVTADDLRAGMLANVTLASDNQTLLTLDAKDAPRVTKKPAPVHDNVWVNVH